MKSCRGCRLGLSCDCPPHDYLREQGNERKLLRGESEGCQRACHLCFRTAVLHETVLHETHETAASQWICQAPARDVGKAKSYQSRFLCELNSGNARAGCCKCPHSSFYKKPKLRASVETVMRRRIQAIKDLDHARLELIHRSSNRISMSRHADHKWNQSVRNCHESHRRGMSGIRQ